MWVSKLMFINTCESRPAFACPIVAAFVNYTSAIDAWIFRARVYINAAIVPSKTWTASAFVVVDQVHANLRTLEHENGYFDSTRTPKITCPEGHVTPLQSSLLISHFTPSKPDGHLQVESCLVWVTQEPLFCNWWLFNGQMRNFPDIYLTRL